MLARRDCAHGGRHASFHRGSSPAVQDVTSRRRPRLNPAPETARPHPPGAPPLGSGARRPSVSPGLRAKGTLEMSVLRCRVPSLSECTCRVRDLSSASGFLHGEGEHGVRGMSCRMVSKMERGASGRGTDSVGGKQMVTSSIISRDGAPFALLRCFGLRSSALSPDPIPKHPSPVCVRIGYPLKSCAGGDV